MLFELLDRDRNRIGFFSDVFNDEINREINDIYTLSFCIPYSNDPIFSEIRENRLVHYLKKDEYYIIRLVKDVRDANNKKYKHVECDLQPAELMEDIVSSFVLIDRTAEDALKEALKGNRYGWTVGTVDVTAVRSLDEVTFSSRWELITSIRDTWGGELGYDTANKKISLLNQIGSDEELIIAYGLNMTAIERTLDCEDWGTRLYALGKDNLTTASVNGTGQDYIDADTVSLYGIKDYIWKTDINDPAILHEAALKKLELIKQPKSSYTVNLVDIQSIPGYENFAFSLGDIVRVIDKELGIDIKSRFVSEKEIPSQKGGHIAVIDSVPNSYKTLQAQLVSILNRVKESGDTWDKAKLIDDNTQVEYGKIDYEVNPKPRMMFTNQYYSRPVAFVGLQKEADNVSDPPVALTLVSDFVTSLDENGNMLFDGVEVTVVNGPDTLAGYKITVWAICRDPVVDIG